MPSPGACITYKFILFPKRTVFAKVISLPQVNRLCGTVLYCFKVSATIFISFNAVATVLLSFSISREKELFLFGGIFLLLHFPLFLACLRHNSPDSHYNSKAHDKNNRSVNLFAEIHVFYVRQTTADHKID